jgi:transposase
VLCADPFHVVSRATGAPGEVRREVWRQARTAGQTRSRVHGSRVIRQSAAGGADLKRARYPLWKYPGNLTTAQEAKLAWIEKTHPYLYRAYLLMEGLRLPFQLKGEEGKYALDRWLSWAARCRIPEFTELATKIRKHLKASTPPSTTGSATA